MPLKQCIKWCTNPLASFNISKRIIVKLKSFLFDVTVPIANWLIAVIIIEIVKTAKLIGWKGYELVIKSYSVNTLRVKFCILLINWFILPPGFRLNTILVL